MILKLDPKVELLRQEQTLPGLDLERRTEFIRRQTPAADAQRFYEFTT